MKQNKEFKTYEEQLQILIDKGLIIDNNSLNTLKRNNYYFLINRYKNLFIIPDSKPNIFKKGTHFNEIVAVYNFDRELRMILLKYITTIENTLKSIVSYEFAKKYNHDYLSLSSFDTFNNDYQRIREIEGFFKIIKSVIKTSLKHNHYIKHYYINYEKIPFWVIVNDLSFGNIIKFYSYMKPLDQENIANQFSLTKDELYSYLKVLLHFRNLSAHNQRVFDEKSSDEITRNNYHHLLGLNKDEGLNDIMAVLIIGKSLLENDDFKNFLLEFKRNLEILDKNVNTIDVSLLLSKMGMNNNWFNMINN